MSKPRPLRADVAAYLRHIDSVRNLSAHTLRAYRTDLDEMVVGLEALGIKHADAVDLFLLRRYLTTLRDRGLAPRSTARKISAIRAFFAWLAESGRLAADPAESLRLPKRPRDLPKVLGREEIAALLDYRPEGGGWAAARDRALLETLYSTGARVSEMQAMDLVDVDLDDGTVVLKGKGRKERIAGLGRPCIEALEDYLVAVTEARARKDRRAVFLNRFGGRLTTRGIARVDRKSVV